MMVVLWTDALIFVLLIGMIVLSVYMLRNPRMTRPLRQIGTSKTGMVSLTVLLFFVAVGLLDSMHFHSKDSNEIVSVLDQWLSPIRLHGEKTYSAPFAAHLFGKELMVLEDGGPVWAYPRLQYGGAHLDDPESELFYDVLMKASFGFIKSAIPAAIVLVLLVQKFRHRQNALISQASAKAVAWTIFWIVTLCATLLELSSYYHVLGTDKVGEDVLYQAIKSIRTGLVIGTLTTLIMLPLAIVFGILAGFFRGWVDDTIQYLYTTLNSIPSVLLIAASILVVQVYMAKNEEQFTSLIVRADMRLLFLCIILGVTSWTGLCRMLRAETLKLREMEYVQAASALGVRRRIILFRHILPNVMHIVLISVVLDFSSLVLAEAVLSYINIGVDPTTHSWGNMINGARLEMAREPVVWWSLTASFLFMFTLVLAANLFADSVRDAFDPRRMG
ncbi:ABC transporter permease [Methylotuvimicrobium buryatense]|uniref:ABC transporter permease n=2 Tax=Methylotuvimicrobium buryatense TaxID=95641 RepID=A0A4P9UQ34_METBY|nr:ABC transporter permease [Methylotuvimicrobium buryatense]